MGTTNYNFTYLEADNPINLVGDTTTFLDEIDSALHNTDVGLARANTVIHNPWHLIMGDSWTDTSRTDTYSKWAKDAILKYPRTKSYGVSGARASNLPSQVSAASADTAFDNSQVTKITVIVGVNDFNNNVNQGTFAGQLDAFNESIHNTFPNAECVIFFDCPNPTCELSPAYGKTFDGAYQYCMTAKNVMSYGNLVWLGHFLPSNAFYDFTQVTAYHTYHMSPLGNTVMRQLHEAFVNGAPLATSGRLIEANANVYYARVEPNSNGTKTVKDTFFALTRYNTVVRGNANKDESALYTIHSGAHATIQNCFEYVVIVPKDQINNFNGTFGVARNYRNQIESNRGTLDPVSSTGLVSNTMKQYPLLAGYNYYTNVTNGIVNLRSVDYVIIGAGVMSYDGGNTVTSMSFGSWEQYATDSAFL